MELRGNGFWNTRTNSGSTSRGGNGKVHGGLLIFPNVKKEMHQVLSERGRLVACSIWQVLRLKIFTKSICFVTD